MSAPPGLGALAEIVVAASSARPLLVAVAGPVAVGKSTLAADLATDLAADLATDLAATVLCTDSFLLPNAVLSERDALMRKGFPDTYDTAALAAVLDTLRRGRPATVPVYSHDTYDVVVGQHHVVEPTDVVIVEGVNVLQPELASHVDLRVYLHAEEEHVKEWYTARFLDFHRRAATEGGFYAAFAHLDAAEVRQLAEATWDAVNGPNLHRHIAPTRAHADVVVTKAADHTMVAVERVSPGGGRGSR